MCNGCRTLRWSTTRPLVNSGARTRCDWVVSSHRIEYFLPAFVGEEIEIKTWVENIQRVRSLRMYEFIRRADGKTLVKGETDWVFVDMKSGRPLVIPEEVKKVFVKNN